MTDERRLSFAGGVAILSEVFEQLGIESMRVADGAMREGLLYDLLGRYTDEDARERTVRSMQERYHVDLAQAERVETTAVAFLNQLEESWLLTDPAVEQALRWAARLHEIGLDVAHSGYHRHGAYLLANADMAGFPREEQKLLAFIVGSHRRKPALEQVDELIPPWDKRAPYIAYLLRIAVLLHRGRSSVALPDIKLTGACRLTRDAFSAGLARRSSADRRRPADRDRTAEGRRIPPAGVQREVDVVYATVTGCAAGRVTCQQRALRVAYFVILPRAQRV